MLYCRWWSPHYFEHLSNPRITSIVLNLVLLLCIIVSLLLPLLIAFYLFRSSFYLKDIPLFPWVLEACLRLPHFYLIKPMEILHSYSWCKNTWGLAVGSLAMLCTWRVAFPLIHFSIFILTIIIIMIVYQSQYKAQCDAWEDILGIIDMLTSPNLLLIGLLSLWEFAVGRRSICCQHTSCVATVMLARVWLSTTFVSF